MQAVVYSNRVAVFLLSVGWKPYDSRPQTQLVLIRKQLYNRWCKDHPAAVEAACAKITGQSA